MQSLTEVQNHLAGLEDIRHLLRSLRAMSAIRWRRARMHLHTAKIYAASVDAQLGLMLALEASPGRHIVAGLSAPAATGAIGLITLTSDRGLCGTFNAGLVSQALHLIQRWQRQGHMVKIISLGGYGERLFRKAGHEVLHTERFPLTHVISFVAARDVITRVKDFYESGAISELYLLYNQFLSFGRYESVLTRLLPPDLTRIVTRPRVMPEDLILGSARAELQVFLLWEHLATRLYLALIESLVSEHSARLQTMDAAISNIDERVTDLELRYHAIRQERITQEVLEVQSNLQGRGSRSGLSHLI
ncbi:MAG: F0F1 ATP synthase subunit gamma [Anaerolineae bacterium]|nr:F0F1 ATP synthase subunit gamma [Anaerolineae bacterium]